MRNDSEELPLVTLSEARLRLLMDIYGSPQRWDKRTIPTKALVEPYEVAALCRYMLVRLDEERLKRMRARRG